MIEKTCPHCEQLLPLTLFRLRPATEQRREHHDSWCRACTAQSVRDWYLRKGDEWNAKRRAAYVPHPKVRGANLDPAKKAAKKKRRKALERGATISDFTAEQWLHLKMAFGQRCAYCHKKKPLTQDHVIPLVRGGNHTASNIVPACQSCNSRKSAGQPPIFQPALVLS